MVQRFQECLEGSENNEGQKEQTELASPAPPQPIKTTSENSVLSSVACHPPVVLFSVDEPFPFSEYKGQEAIKSTTTGESASQPKDPDTESDSKKEPVQEESIPGNTKTLCEGEESSSCTT